MEIDADSPTVENNTEPQAQPAADTAKTDQTDEANNQESAEPEKKDPNEQRHVPKARFDEVWKERQSYRRERDELLARMSSLEEAVRPPVTEVKKPSIEDFDSVPEYLEALNDFNRAELRKELEAERKAETDRIKAQEEQRGIEKRLSEVAGRYEDFVDVMENTVLPPDAAWIPKLAGNLRNGYEVLYHAAKSGALQEWCNLHPDEVRVEIALLSRDLRTKQATSVAPERKPVTQAPQPLAPTRGTGTGRKSPSEMSMDEYVAWRKRQ